MTDEIDDGDKDGWVRHRITQNMLETYKADRAKRLENLKNVAKTSSDLRVYQAYAEFAQADFMCDLFAGKWKRS